MCGSLCPSRGWPLTALLASSLTPCLSDRCHSVNHSSVKTFSRAELALRSWRNDPDSLLFVSGKLLSHGVAAPCHLSCSVLQHVLIVLCASIPSDFVWSQVLCVFAQVLEHEERRGLQHLEYISDLVSGSLKSSVIPSSLFDWLAVAADMTIC